MLKKRLTFTLLYSAGFFYLSRNFRLQQVGDLEWLLKNYQLQTVLTYVDELFVIDVSRTDRDHNDFCRVLSIISQQSFLPITAGGGISSLSYVAQLFSAGADKVLVNTAIWSNPELLVSISSRYGSQALVASLDVKRTPAGYLFLSSNATTECQLSDEIFNLLMSHCGEILLTSIDQDGTGQGYDFKSLTLLPLSSALPVIISGGAGNSDHLRAGLQHERVDAVNTAHLFNFVGDGLKQARIELLQAGIQLAHRNNCPSKT